jgi:signal transduction histidine kinase
MSRSRLLGAFAIVLCLPVVTVAWLGFRLIEQDRALEKQRVAEGRELAVSQAVETLSALLSDPKLLSQDPGEGAILSTAPGSSLLYREAAPPQAEARAELFGEAESLEFGRGEAAAASDLYRKQTQSSDPLIRAGALYRLGRSLNKAGRRDEALEAYAALARMDTAAVGGWPAPAAALWSRCNLLESAGRTRELRDEATKLGDLLVSRRYPMTRAAYVAFAEDAARWSGRPRPLDLERLTDAVLQVEAALRNGTRPSSGRGALIIQGAPVTVVWGQSAGAVSIFAGTRAFVEREWLSKLGPGVWLSSDGNAILGSPAPGPAAIRHATESNLPWTVLAIAPAAGLDLGSRRNLLLLLLAAVGAFTLTGAYIVVRALRKEFALGRMQEDFVAAVSHEFRTPLTTLRQIAESLEDGRVASDEKRAAYYRALSRATQRLHRLVEDVLDFRRMQSGAIVYRRTPIPVREFTTRVVSEFQREAAEQGFRIEAAQGPDVDVMADGEALSRALWNLLDNAVKYSGEARSVELEAECRGRFVAWSVRDHGIGIPERERPLVFDKFYRGEGARHSGIRGTGIGLAMVQQIAAAHGGRVSVASKEGEGSVFTISIPCEDPACRES